MGKKKKWIVSVIGVEEEKLAESGLPKKGELGSLPDRLDHAVRGIAPQALGLDMVFLLTDDQRTKVEAFLEAHSLPFHEYAVESRGERCTRDGCLKHRERCTVIRLHDHIQSHERARRAAEAERAADHRPDRG